MTDDCNGTLPFPQMNRCPIGTEATTRPVVQYQAGTSWNEVSFRLQLGAPALIKEQEDKGHLKETEANQTGDMHA